MADNEFPQPPKTPAPHKAHTYEDDLAKAMNTIDAPVVQEMLATAREREESERFAVIGRKQRRWYSLFSILFLILAAGGFGYGIWHYTNLTVPVEQQVPVGVFKNTAPTVITEATVDDLVQGLVTSTDLEEGEPLLIPLVTDATSLTPVTKNQFFAFIGAQPSEPFVYSMDTIRLGVMNTGDRNKLFVVLSVSDPQLASKEFLIAEPKLLTLFSRVLAINPDSYLLEEGKGYTGTYLYNLPMRILSTTDESQTERPVILYGYATGNVIVVTTDPSVLKAVSDTIIRQR